MSKKYVFSDSDCNSGDGMMTSVWGPPMWHILHTISFNYPVEPTKEHKINYYNWCDKTLKGRVRCYSSDSDNDREWWGFTEQEDIVLWTLKWM